MKYAVIVALIAVGFSARSTCPHNEVYQSCGTYCPATCMSQYSSGLMCPAACAKGCFCQSGLVRDDSTGNCVDGGHDCSTQCHEEEEHCQTMCNGIAYDSSRFDCCETKMAIYDFEFNMSNIELDEFGKPDLSNAKSAEVESSLVIKGECKTGCEILTGIKMAWCSGVASHENSLEWKTKFIRDDF